MRSCSWKPSPRLLPPPSGGGHDPAARRAGPPPGLPPRAAALAGHRTVGRAGSRHPRRRAKHLHVIQRCTAHGSSEFTPGATATGICAAATTHSPSPSSTAPPRRRHRSRSSCAPTTMRSPRLSVIDRHRSPLPHRRSMSASSPSSPTPAPGSLSVAALRSRCRVRNATLLSPSGGAVQPRRPRQVPAGYRLTNPPDASLPVLSTPPGNGTREPTD